MTRPPETNESLPREICQIYDCLCDTGTKKCVVAAAVAVVGRTPTGDLFPAAKFFFFDPEVIALQAAQHAAH